MWMIDLVIEVFSIVVGIPMQEWRSRRLVAESGGQVVLSYPDPRSALLSRRMAGVARFGAGFLEMGSWRTNVVAVDRHGRAGLSPDRQDSRMIFGAKQTVYRVYAERGSFDMTLLAGRSQDLIALLKVARR